MSDFYSISEIARISGKDRRTVAARFAHITPAKESANLKQYSIEQFLNLIFEDTKSNGVDGLSPAEELAYWNAKLKELEYRIRMGEVCEVTDAARQCSLTAKGILQPLEMMPDEGEADGMPLKWLLWTQRKIDKIRDIAAENLMRDEEQDNVCES